MTLSTRPMIAALLAAVFSAQAVNAQASPPPRPPQDVTPALLPPPPASPRPETVAPRTRAAAQVAPQGEETLRTTPVAPRRVSAPVDSVRPTVASPQQAQAVREPPRADPPPPPPATRQPALNATQTAAPDGPPPTGATARCKDGTYLFTPTNQQSCSDRGGLAVTLASRPAPPTPPRRP